MTNTYNGWTNRETWLVNLYYGDSFSSYMEEMVEEGDNDLAEAKQVIAENDFADEQNRKEYRGDVIQEIADMYKNYVEELLYEELEKLSGFLSDFIDLGLIDWYDLARSVFADHMED